MPIPLSWHIYLPQNLHASVTAQISSFLDYHGVSTPSFAAAYFRSIHYHFPILSPQRCFIMLERSAQVHRADIYLLMLALYLLTCLPDPDMRALRPSTLAGYALGKSSLGLLEATASRSVEALQASTLMTLFEVGHGMGEQACVSVIAASKAGMLLKKGTMSMEMQEDVKAACCGIETLDRWAIPSPFAPSLAYYSKGFSVLTIF
jgi:hypothetical protein